jgi:tetratricopeptide (TPR) repeat protein
MSHRLNFDLEDASKAYEKALELAPDSVEAKRDLADMYRALGKSEAALKLYTDLTADNVKYPAARTGYILTLFETGKKTDAEREMAAALEANPGNVVLMAGAAYWYASKGDGDKAVELARKAIDRDPRYIWSHIALARGQMAQRKPVDAEQTLIKARKYGNFPTLEYELASARVQAGFYREALEELRKSFTVTDGKIVTKLGGRVARSGDDIAELIAGERRASILAAAGGDAAETAAQLKQLLILDTALAAAQPDEAAVVKAADDFVNASPAMKVHRQLYAANALLQKRVGAAKAAEIAAAATDLSDSAFDAPDAAAAVLASELYDARAAAFARNDFLLVPEVPKQTLSAIVRGRIEETAGWALYQQEKYPEADVRLRRAISVMPDKSAWWRSSMWRLGAVLAAEGKDKEALDHYVQSYKTDRPDYVKYITIESLYRKVNGGTEGLDALVGADRVVASANMQTSAVAAAPSQPVADTAAKTEPVNVDTMVSQPIVKIPKSVPTDGGTSGPPSDQPLRSVAEPQVKTAENAPAPTDDKIDTRTEPIAEKKQEPAAEQSIDKKVEPTAEVKPDTAANPPVEKKAEPTAEDATEKKPDVALDAPVEKKPDAETRSEAPADASVEKKADAPSDTTIEKKAEPPVDKPEDKPSETQPEAAAKTKPAEVEVPKVEPQPDAPRTDAPTDASTASSDKTSDAKPPQKHFESAAASRLVVVTEDNIPTKPVEIRPRQKPSTITATPAQNKTLDAMKPLFEPIVISVPEAGKQDSAASSSDRPRVVPGVETKADIEPCTVTVSQEKVSIPQGRSVALIVGIDGKGDAADLQGVASSPADIEVTAQPEIAGMEGKRLFMLKSVAALSGVFQVTFQTSCGRKDVVVTIK